MTAQELLEEFGLEIDDVRWYLASGLAQTLVGHREHVSELVRYIWSGRLEDELYHMEERFLADIEAKLRNRRMDEPHARELMQDIRAARRARPSGK